MRTRILLDQSSSPLAGRRGFLGGLSALFVAAVVPGCETNDPEPVVTAGDPLEQFIALSVLLTGFDGLSQVHAKTYLDAIRASADSTTLDDVYAKAGYGTTSPPQSLEDLEARGLFDDDRLRALTDSIILNWYTGVYTSTDGPQVATFTTALTWRAMSYTNPPSVCDNAGSWPEAPAI